MRQILGSIMLILSLTGCESIIHLRGNYVEEADLQKIEAGVTTRKEVFTLLGPPSHIQMFDGAGWYYLGEKTKEVSFFHPEVLTRKVIYISFASDDKVNKIDIYDDTKGFEFEIIEEKTPTLGRDPSFFKEIFGSIGKYDEGKHRAGYV